MLDKQTESLPLAEEIPLLRQPPHQHRKTVLRFITGAGLLLLTIYTLFPVSMLRHQDQRLGSNSRAEAIALYLH